MLKTIYVDPFDGKTQMGHRCDVLDRSILQYDFLVYSLHCDRIVLHTHLRICNYGKILNSNSLD